MSGQSWAADGLGRQRKHAWTKCKCIYHGKGPRGSPDSRMQEETEGRGNLYGPSKELRRERETIFVSLQVWSLVITML